ncbi:kinase-like protein [Pseudovirgaria hyperparasitica]|uniref:Kinase-like protein n=1 Tax=Pseudovirgaria hyperparasitica TaxID=470096 RepID=A0A6A6W539_9PEZI|nr:kinase-like protein [Pseudovirgaria hyperparasitica]KAF2756171.1 kinase-like protein [Pseudovirgaria hyperparasitica]
MSTNGTTLVTHVTSGCPDVPRKVHLHRQAVQSVLLCHGDELDLAGAVKLTFMEANPSKSHHFDRVREKEHKLLQNHYTISTRKLGAGGQGSVYMALERTSGQQLACKTINLQASSRESASQSASRARKTFRELDILKQLSHQNVITIEKVFWTTNTIYLFQELVAGGDLFSYIEFKDGTLADGEACTFVYQILKGVEYLHGLGVVHRDLKPDNILVTSLGDGARIIITDFGSARYSPPSTSHNHPKTNRTKLRMTSLAGTTEFCAPEIYSKNPAVTDAGYTAKVDMWSIGCICATLLSGDIIFADRSHPDFQRNPKDHVITLSARCNLEVLDYGANWSCINKRPKDLIRKLLTLSEDSRLTATEALAHPWFTNKSYATELQAVYDRVVASWKPRRKVFRLVERLQGAEDDLTSFKSPFFQQKAAPGNPNSQRNLSTIPEVPEQEEWRQNQPKDFESRFKQLGAEDIRGARHGQAVKSTAVNAIRRRRTSLYDEGITDLDIQDASAAGDCMARLNSKKARYR